jgi:outer membrane lipoprotein-sorting protein
MVRAGFACSLLLAVTACGVKTVVKVPVSPKIAAAGTATLEELLAMLNRRGAQLRSLASTSLKVTLTLQDRADQDEVLQQYRSAPAYVLARRPGDILMNVQNPLTKTTVLTIASKGDPFEIWMPRDNRLYTGSNSAGRYEFEEGGKAVAFSARPAHIFEAILEPPLPLDAPGVRIAKTERQDAEAKYYVLTVLQDASGQEMRILRQLWIERSTMTVVREETFSETGELAGVVQYSEMAEFGGLMLPCVIRMDRPPDGYTLELRLRDWRVNPEFSDTDFVIAVPAGAERVALKQKGTAKH